MKPSTRCKCTHTLATNSRITQTARGATEVEGKKFRFISGTFILAAPNAPHTETHKDRVAVVCVGFDTSTPLPSRLFVDKDRRVADTLRIIGES